MPWGGARATTQSIGGNGDASEGARTTPDAMAARRREDYMHRLGIPMEGRPVFRSPPMSVAEAPGMLQHPAEPGFGSRSRCDSSDSDGSSKQDDFSSGGERGDSFVSSGGGKQEMHMNLLNLKSVDDFRLSYLRKVSYHQVWVPASRRAPQHQTVIIFDWDDTLLCTSYLNMRQGQPPPPNIERYLRGIENASKDLLELSLKLADHTFIITNAMDGWVEWSASKYIPGIVPVLLKVKSNIISARGRYERVFPGDVSKWKLHAFLEVRQQLDSQIITNLISLGDSNFEMDAVHAMGEEFQESLVKTIKFRENPSPEELLKQLVLVHQKFEKIVENVRPLKIGLERKWVGAAKPAS